jgi:hypothetical protein
MLVQCIDRIIALFAAGALDCVQRSLQYLDLRHLKGVELVEWGLDLAYRQASRFWVNGTIEGGKVGRRGCRLQDADLLNSVASTWVGRRQRRCLPESRRDKEWSRRMHHPDSPSTVRDSSKYEKTTFLYAQYQQRVPLQPFSMYNQGCKNSYQQTTIGVIR